MKSCSVCTVAGFAAAAAVSLAQAGNVEPIGDPIEASIEDIGVRIILEPVADGLVAPNWGISAPGQPDRLFVTDQPGLLWSIDLMSGKKGVFLDVSDRLVELGIAGPGSFDERGLLGVAFHPDYQENGLLYTYESHPVSGTADFSTMPAGVAPDHQTVVTEWHVPSPSDPASVVDPASAREVLRIDEPQFNHNAGAMNFGSDGMLYISLGDGGAADDQGVGHPEIGNGQDITTILGTIIRINPLGNDAPSGNYGIPSDNPFVGKPGLDEIYAYGFRNPFRFSFDQLTGELWVADVGQNDIEEVDVVVAGGNYGWRVKEGTFLFEPNGDKPGFVFKDSPGSPPDMIDPVAQYDHDEGIAVIGGFIYRGGSIPALAGKYVFGENSESGGGGNDGRLFHLRHDDRIVEFRFVDDDFDGKLLGVGQDGHGNLYVLANEEGVPFGTEGFVMRISAPTRGDLDADGDVGFDDLLDLLNEWGPCDPDEACDADVDGNGSVGLTDLLLLLANWG